MGESYTCKKCGKPIPRKAIILGEAVETSNGIFCKECCARLTDTAPKHDQLSHRLFDYRMILVFLSLGVLIFVTMLYFGMRPHGTYVGRMDMGLSASSLENMQKSMLASLPSNSKQRASLEDAYRRQQQGYRDVMSELMDAYDCKLKLSRFGSYEMISGGFAQNGSYSVNGDTIYLEIINNTSMVLTKTDYGYSSSIFKFVRVED